MITTFTGKRVDPLNITPHDLEIRDIAHALSLICRGNGQVRLFYSVAQHCIACAKEAEARGYSDRIILACLLHDAAECYLSDVPRPVKEHLQGYRELEDRILEAVWEAFLDGPLSETETEAVRQIDDDLLWYDLAWLLDGPDTPEPVGMRIPVTERMYRERAFDDVEDEYMEMFWMYRGETGPVIILEDLADAFEEATEYWDHYLDTRTGKIVSVPDPDHIMGRAIEGFGELAEEIEEGDGFLKLPTREELHEWQIMSQFAARQEENAREQLQKALYQNHPLRRFRETAMRTGLSGTYYAFRREELLRRAEEYCDTHGLRCRHRRKNEKRLFR